MHAANAPRRCARRLRYEYLEDRLVLSSLPCLPQAPSTSPSSADLEVNLGSASPLASTTETAQLLDALRDAYGFDGTGQTVAVIDTGIAYDHIALGAGYGTGHRVVGGWDFTEENDADPYDDAPAGFHGTHVAGIIGADDADHPGLAPGVDLVALRVFNDWGSGQMAWIEHALQWVHQHRHDFRYPITAVNMSLGTNWNGTQPPIWAAFEDELRVLEEDGITVVAAAGNSFGTYHQVGLTYPAASPYVIPAASVDASGQLSQFSQRDSRVLAAPGEMIVSTVPDYTLGADGIANDWAAATGTSMAAPYVTGASVLVREAMQWVGTTAITPSSIYRALYDTADLVYDAATQLSYHRVNLERAIATLMPADEAGDSPASAMDLGTLREDRHINGLLTRRDDVDTFRVQAESTGELVIDVNGDAPFRLLGPDGQAIDSLLDKPLRINVQAGRQYIFTVAATDHLAKYQLDLSLHPTSAVRVDGHVIQVLGTAGNDQIELAVGDRFEVRVNDQVFHFDTNTPWRFEIHGAGGNDLLVVHGSSGTDQVMLRPGRLEMNGELFSLFGDGFKEIVVYSGGGRNDIARLYDAPTRDQFVATPTEARLEGAGYVNRVIGFAHVYAYASNPAGDVATLRDSADNDLLTARPNSVTLQGNGFENHAIGFQQVTAYASAGNHDLARFYDSPGNDLFVANASKAWMTGDTYLNKAFGFEQVEAVACSGVDDVARLWGTDGDDLFVGRGNVGYLRGTGYYNKASGFDRLYADAGTGGNDIAYLYSTIGRDVFWSRGGYGALYGTNYYNRVTNFERISGYATKGAGADAELVGSAAMDRFQNWLRRSSGADMEDDSDSSVPDTIANDLLKSLYAVYELLERPVTPPGQADGLTFPAATVHKDAHSDYVRSLDVLFAELDVSDRLGVISA